MAEVIIENERTYEDRDTDRLEYVTECNACEYYRRGECGRTGLAQRPDDYCSDAVKAEA